MTLDQLIGVIVISSVIFYGIYRMYKMNSKIGI